MARLNVTVKVNNRPLRRAFVEHLWFGAPVQMCLTDNDGRVRDGNGNLGIDSLSPGADIRIHCQNSVVKVLDGSKLNVPVTQDRSIKDGDVVDLTTTAHQQAHYAILNRALLIYDVVFRQFRPFSSRSAPDFPLGRQPSLQATKNQRKRIEISYPSQFPLGHLAFVEPRSISTTYPLVHFRRKQDDPRLFGAVRGTRPTLIPAEMSHALHFTLFSEANRRRIEATYIGWITADIASGGSGTHQMGRRTSPEVAFIEALDHFAHRFAEYIREVEQGGNSTLLRQQTMTDTIRQAFLERELSGAPVTGVAAATLDSNMQVLPNASFHGGDDEGSVYGCIFLDFARRVGLITAVNAYLQSAAAGALSFGEYKAWVGNNLSRQALARLTAAQRTWNL